MHGCREKMRCMCVGPGPLDRGKVRHVARWRRVPRCLGRVGKTEDARYCRKKHKHRGNCPGTKDTGDEYRTEGRNTQGVLLGNPQNGPFPMVVPVVPVPGAQRSTWIYGAGGRSVCRLLPESGPVPWSVVVDVTHPAPLVVIPTTSPWTSLSGGVGGGACSPSVAYNTVGW